MFGLSSRIDFNVNLNEPLKETKLRTLLFTEDAESTEIHLNCRGMDGRPYDLTGYTASLYVQRADGATVLINGTVSGDDAYFTLPEAALIVQGGLKMAARLEKTTGTAPNQVMHRKVIWAGDAIVRLTSTDSIVDSSSVIPSLSELLAQIERMESLHDNNVRGYYASLAALQAAQPSPYPGDLYGVGTSSFTYYIWDGVASAWKDLGDIYQPKAASKTLWSSSTAISDGDSVTITGIGDWAALGVEISGSPNTAAIGFVTPGGEFRASAVSVNDSSNGNQYIYAVRGQIDAANNRLTIQYTCRLRHDAGQTHQSRAAVQVVGIYGLVRKESAE